MTNVKFEEMVTGCVEELWAVLESRLKFRFSKESEVIGVGSWWLFC